MAPKIFLLGATGYIGGDALYALVQTHPEYEIACLVRNSDKGAQVASQYVKARLVYGTLDDGDILGQEAKKADIVLNCANADNENAVNALTKGLAARAAETPGFYIHTSGNAILFVADIDRKIYGETSSKIYNDWEGIGEVTSLPDHAPHRKNDKNVISAEGPKVKTAIICPPTIYGPGRGPGNQRSHQIPELARSMLEKKKGLQVGVGENLGPNVHVHDLSDCYVKLVEAAVEGGGNATWGKEGYYFAENGEHIWGHISKAVAKAAHKQGFLPSDEVVSISEKEADDLAWWGSALWGANSRFRAIRARKLLGWLPKKAAKDLDGDILEVVSAEAKSLGLVPGHAAKVAG
ncbi:hypothetical protein HO173_002361 [Letharia columbiana]|uniref:Semialdehyde dehydrogenase NAD-binding domain-containing protein n=1 Tax=Letharia columbiana TaxID=112416 RepID=A0A8H6G3P5_9LECA|nr:uncharacterized protein HO173_002361 [Letharia columbiana]KAF6239815.1 hypothetical protein HO173_002361 [Letharia columbiana]